MRLRLLTKLPKAALKSLSEPCFLTLSVEASAFSALADICALRVRVRARPQAGSLISGAERLHRCGARLLVYFNPAWLRRLVGHSVLQLHIDSRKDMRDFLGCTIMSARAIGC